MNHFQSWYLDAINYFIHTHRAFFSSFTSNHGGSHRLLHSVLFCAMRLSPSAVPTTLTSFSPVLHHDLLRIVLPAFCMLELFEVISLRILHVDERLGIERL